jgi:hypothetical protein
LNWDILKQPVVYGVLTLPKFDVYLYEKPIDLTKGNKPCKKGFGVGYTPAIVARQKMDQWNFEGRYVGNINMKLWLYEGCRYIMKLEEIK